MASSVPENVQIYTINKRVYSPVQYSLVSVGKYSFCDNCTGVNLHVHVDRKAPTHSTNRLLLFLLSSTSLPQLGV